MEFVRLDSAATTPVLGRWTVLATPLRGPDALRTALTLPGAQAARWTRAHLHLAEAIALGRRGRHAAASVAFVAGDRDITDPVPMPHYRHMARRLVAEAAIADRVG